MLLTLTGGPIDVVIANSARHTCGGCVRIWCDRQSRTRPLPEIVADLTVATVAVVAAAAVATAIWLGDWLGDWFCLTLPCRPLLTRHRQIGAIVASCVCFFCLLVVVADVVVIEKL